MDFLTNLFFNTQSRDEKNEINYIVKGYPLTTSPVVPDILKHQVEFKKVQRVLLDNVGFTLAHEGSDLVQSESLEVIRKKLLEWFHVDESFCKNFSTEFPKNLIAISFAHFNFEVGESCQEYKLRDSVKPSENGHFSYRKLSECIQCTYFNENGVEFLAGITFYPAPHGRPQLLKSNDALLYLAICSIIDYPLGHRQKSWGMTQYKQYGRFCSVAGKQVLLRLQDGIPLHFDYDHVTNEYRKSLCKECCKDYFTYHWEEPKKDASTTAAPVVTVGESIPAAVTATDSESSPVSHASSTESFIEEFDKIDFHSVPPPC
ncbi:hypothetical protein CAEBREN_18032 [Caenorhabditis brenneri]|uniref:Uncharacterized protein n=1 Tax=Caenorhabditis brenneri TaxID=135651 RepID=G0NFN8_CAEBE|nr:hypothetical protein CAEBREN_18032 [Caenorhabditis brenneri]